MGWSDLGIAFMNEEDKWIFVDNRSKRLILRFRVKGFENQMYIASGLKDTKKNRGIVRVKRDAILGDIALGQFDETLERYKFKAGKNLKKKESLPAPKPLDLVELWELYTKYKSNLIEETTLLTKYPTIAYRINLCPYKEIDDAPKIRDWALANLSKLAAWDFIQYLNSSCDWAVDSKIILLNPFEKLKVAKPKKKSTEESRRAFTLEQRDLIIEAFEQSERFGHYAPLIKFLFWTGARPGEAFALRWSDVSDDCSKIHIYKSCNAYRILKGTKNGKRRIFPAAEGGKLQRMLLDLRTSNDGLVFVTKDATPVTSVRLSKIWLGRTEGQYVYKGVVGKMSDEGLIPYLPPYATRHTFATWAISSGISPDRVAMYIGDTVQTVLNFYCHPEIVQSICPDF